MSDRKPLMPKATAVWLVENTSLTFDQIAEFCGLHVLEVKGIADGDVAHGIKGMDPISNGQLTREEIARAEENDGHNLQLAPSKVVVPEVKTKSGPRYTPVSRRHDRPNAVLWLLRSHPELRDSQIMRLVGTTKPTIDAEVKKAATRVEKERREQMKEMEKAGTLLPASETVPGMGPQPMIDMPFPEEDERPRAETEAEEQARVLAKLREMGGKKPEDEEDQP